MRKVLGIALTGLLAGCFNIDMLMEINGPDDVNYTLKMSSPVEMSFILESMKDSLQNFDSVNIETENDTVYLTATSKHIPIDSLTKFGFNVKKESENRYRIWMEKNTSPANDSQEDEMMEALLSQYRITLTLIVNKGKVIESNADSTSESAFVWKSPITKIDEFAPAFVIEFPSSGAFNTPVILAGIVIVLLAAGVFLFIRRK